MNTMFAKIILTYYIISCVSSVRQRKDMSTSIKNLFGEYNTEITTFDNVCYGSELKFPQKVHASSIYLYLHKNAKTQVLVDYQNYMKELIAHNADVLKYLTYLEKRVKDSINNYDDYQLDYIKMRVFFGLKDVYGTLKTINNKLNDYKPPTIHTLTDCFTDIHQKGEFSHANSNNYYTNLKDYFHSVGTYDQDKVPKKIKNKIEYLVCNDIINALLDVFRTYSDNEVEIEPHIKEFFNIFIQYDYEGYNCVHRTKYGSAFKYLIQNFFIAVYGEEADLLSFPDLEKNLIDINNFNTSVPDVFKPIHKTDAAFIEFHNNFKKLNLDDLKTLKNNKVPISAPFIEFLGQYPIEYEESGLQLIEYSSVDVKKDFFQRIYQIYMFDRILHPENTREIAAKDFPTVAKRLYDYIMDTTDFNEIPNTDDTVQVALKNLIPIKIFHYYRLPMLIILRGKFMDSVTEIGELETQKIINIINKLPNFVTVIPQDVINKVYSKKVGKALVTKETQYILEAFRNKKFIARSPKTTFSQIGNSREISIQSLEPEDLIPNPDEDKVEEYSKEKDIKDLKKFFGLDKNKPPIMENFTDKLNEMVKQLVEERDPIKNTYSVEIINDALANISYSPDESHEIEKLKDTIVKLVTKANDYTITRLLKDINSPGLFNLFLYLSNTHYAVQHLFPKNDSPHNNGRLKFFTFDKLLFLHKWLNTKKNEFKTVKEEDRDTQFKNIKNILMKELSDDAQLKAHLSIKYAKRTVTGYETVYKVLMRPSTMKKYFKGFHLMTKMVNLFDKFLNISDDNTFVSDKHHNKLLLLYNIILHIRATGYNPENENYIELLLKMLNDLKFKVLKNDMDNSKKENVSQYYSFTFKEIADVELFLTYVIKENNGNNIAFESQIVTNFSMNTFKENYKHAIHKTTNFKHNPYNFGSMTLGAGDFIYSMHVKNPDFLHQICNEKMEKTSFCLQGTIFSNTIKFLMKEQIFTFDDWVNTSIPKNVQGYVSQNKSVIFAVLEMVQNKHKNLNQINVSNLHNLINAEEYTYMQLRKNKGNSDNTYTKTNFYKYIILQETDKEWLINYMFFNHLSTFDKSKQNLYEACKKLVSDDNLSKILKFTEYTQDIDLAIRFFRNRVLKAILKYTRSYMSLNILANYLIKNGRAHLLVYLINEDELTNDVLVKFNEIDPQAEDTEKKMLNIILNGYAHLEKDLPVKDETGENLEEHEIDNMNSQSGDEEEDRFKDFDLDSSFELNENENYFKEKKETNIFTGLNSVKIENSLKSYSFDRPKIEPIQGFIRVSLQDLDKSLEEDEKTTQYNGIVSKFIQNKSEKNVESETIIIL